ncbi:thioredoxin domain-containing protein 9-like isoform X2 [Cimex lectularius]|nr:thioredoxin domain-containing protein 9-like isoform X2 [Cimex lectularius]
MTAIDQTQLIDSIVKTVESQVDKEIEKLDSLSGSDLERIRNERLAALKKEAEQKRLWQTLGHGEYLEIDEKDFFYVTKKSGKVVAHFYKSDAPRCKIFDHHMKLLAPRHMETRFVKLDAEKCPFLTGRLNIKVIPTLLIVIDNITKDKIIGFTELGNCDDFSTEMLEWRLGKSAAINYDGDLLHPPEKLKMHQKIQRINKKTSAIRGRESDCSDSD